MNHDHSCKEENSSTNLTMNSIETISASSGSNFNFKMDDKIGDNDQGATKWPGVKLREKRQQTSQEKSETQRKRNSKNRLSNRRSTGFVTPEEIEAAMTLPASENENF